MHPAFKSYSPTLQTCLYIYMLMLYSTLSVPNYRSFCIIQVYDLYGIFSVQSMYISVFNVRVLPINTFLWKLKLLLKVKVFVWLLHQGVILTKNNLARRKWHGNKKYCYCSYNETIQHIFFECHMARLIWRIIHTALVCINLIMLFIVWVMTTRDKVRGGGELVLT